jgi:hypothetical protein
MRINAMEDLQSQLAGHFQQLGRIETLIREVLAAHADGKKLKGNERVGWLGEIYIKTLFGGKLVEDSFEHDVETSTGLRISVKTRKGCNNGWQRSSAIPKIEGPDCPTHLAFVRLDDTYTVDKVWLYEWSTLLQTGRFKKHIVREKMRSYIFQVNERNDKDFLIYSAIKKTCESP